MSGSRKPTGKPRGRPRLYNKDTVEPRGRQPCVKYKQLEPTAPKPPKAKRPLGLHERVVYTLPDRRNERAVALIDAINDDGTVNVTVCYILDEEGIEGDWIGTKDRVNQSVLKRVA